MRPRHDPVDSSPAFVQTVRQVLARHRYDPEHLLERLGAHAEVGVNPRTLPALLHATAAGTPLDTLIRLFVLGRTVPLTAARDAIGSADGNEQVSAWCDAGLLARDGEAGIQSPFRISFHSGVAALIDPPGHDVADDHVVGLGPSSAELIAACTPAAVERALDLGTGCGGTAVRLAAHARQVVATDLNPRAGALARFNAALNGADNIEVRVGDLLEPVASERFDLVCMNPPFVISPGGHLMYRDGGEPGDGFMRRIVSEVPGVLTEGGVAVLTAQWATVAGMTREERLTGWIREAGCDALVVIRQDLDPAGYAAGWMTEMDDDPELASAELQRWLDFYAAHRIEGMTLGWLVLRRSERPGQVTFVDGREGVGGAAFETLMGLFDANRYLQRTPDLRTTCLALAPELGLEQRQVPGDDGWATVSTRLHLGGALPTTMNLDPAMAHLLGRCNGARTVEALAAELAGRLGAAPNAVLAGVQEPIRRLIARGVLEIRTPG